MVLEATHAFHSKHMDPILGLYKEKANSVKNFGGAKCDYISGMRGSLVAPSKIGSDYWVDHTREKVCFLEASKTAVQLGCQIFIEIGPQPVLSALTMMNNDGNLTCLPSLKRNEDEWSTILTSVGKLYLKGISIDWEGFDQFYSRSKVQLPHYPFIGKRFWPETPTQTAGNMIHPLVGSVFPNASSVKLFQGGWNLRSHEYLKDHVIGQTPVFPGAGFLEMTLAAGLATVEHSLDALTKPSRPMKVEDLLIKAPLSVDESKSCQMQTVVELNTSKDNPDEWNDATVKIFQRGESSTWITHATGKFCPIPSAEEQMVPCFKKDTFLQTLANGSPQSDQLNQFYGKMSSVGLTFGPEFRSLEKAWQYKEDTVEGSIFQVKLPKADDSQQSGYILHPIVLDAMIQSLIMPNVQGKMKKKLHVPIKVGKFIWLSSGADADSDARYIYTYPGTSGDAEEDAMSAARKSTALLLDSNGNILAIMSDVEFIDTTARALESVLDQQQSQMADLWEETWRPKIGPMQYSLNMKEITKERFYSDEFYENMVEKHSKLSADLEETFQNLCKLDYYHLLRCFYQCGWKPVLGSVFNGDDLFKELGIQSEFRQLFHYFLRVFEEEGLLKKIDGLSSSSWKIVSEVPTLLQVEELLSGPTFTKDLVQAFDCTRLISKIGMNLKEILTGKLPALAILFPGEEAKQEWPSVAAFYDEYSSVFQLSTVLFQVVQAVTKHIKENGKDRFIFRILEIGAGTGSCTSQVIQCMEDFDMEYEYTFTDISPGFLPVAEQKFEKYAKSMKFKKLNIEEDPISQGFVPGYYDMIVASDVVHATRNLKETFGHARMLMKPGGVFSLMEQTRVNRFVTVMFGLLEGFWRFEDFDVRPDHCTLSTKKWTEVLEQTGFQVAKSFPACNEYHSSIISYKRVEDADESELWRQHQKLGAPIKSWVIFHLDDNPTCNFLVDRIPMETNRKLIKVTKGGEFEDLGSSSSSSLTPWSFRLKPESEEDFVKLMTTIEEGDSGENFEGIIYCWSLDKRCTTQESVLQPYFNLTKAMLKLKQKVPPRLIAVTNGIVPVEDNDLGHCHPSTIWGYSKALRSERIDVNVCCVDIGGKEDEAGRMQTFYEIFNGELKETQVAYQGTTRYVPKTQKIKETMNDLKLPGGLDRFQLILPESRSIGDLEFGPLGSMSLGEEEIEVQVKSAALNFRDIFSVIKPSEKFKDINAVGNDFAGVVKRIGSKVSMVSLGDVVFGCNVRKTEAALPSHIKLDQRDVLPVPKGMTPSDACTLPAVAATVIHCLLDVAKITEKDTVLVHTASGGVGLVAIQICQHVGAKIIATAGSKRKQNYLRMKYGIEHVFHSRNTKYCEDILRVTNGQLVTVVLNSLTSDGFKEASLKACAKGARFVEMSKLSIWTPEEVKQLRPDVVYTVADAASVGQAEYRRLLKEIKRLTETNVMRPPPYVRFDGVHIREALQYMQKAKHIGKVVCVMPEVKQVNGTSQVYTRKFNENATYLITGGLGGIGFVVCKWMVEKGAKHVLLAGRKSPSPATQQAIDTLNGDFGAKIQAVKLDVGDFQECQDLIEKKIPEMGFPQLRGIMHAAGILNDGLIENQNWPKFSSTLKTKVNGTLNLHELTKHLNLEHFVLFSSIAALWGSPGQSNHSAGNYFEDMFANYRNSVGLPATSVNWGQWGEVGVATEAELPGIKPMSNLQCISSLEYALESQRTVLGVINVESFSMLQKLCPHLSYYLDENLWKSNKNDGNNPINLKSDGFWKEYDSVEGKEEKLNVIRGCLRYILRTILKLDEGDVIEDDANLQEMGVDSLMFVEIKNGIQTALGERVVVNASALRDCTTVRLLSDALIKLIEGEGAEVTENVIPTMEEVAQLIQEDCQLPEHIKAGEGQKRVNLEDISKVLLTGCTGTLGPYILRELSNTAQIKQVICLIRPNRTLSGEERLRKVLQERDLLDQVNLGKVSCVPGNVALDHLGMEPMIWEELCNGVDAVFHCAAVVQHLEHYRKGPSSSNIEMRAVNVGGTKNILEFATTGGKLKHVYNASSLLAVATADEDGHVSENWPEAHDYDGITTISYPITKFVGDVILKEAILKRDIPGKVFRFPLIVGDSKTGRFVLDQNHLMQRYFFILKTGIMPSNPLPLAMLPVDICAWVSLQLFFNPEAANDIYNVSNSNLSVDQEFVGIAKMLGYSVDTVELSEFAQKIRESTSEDSPFAIFKDFYQSDDALLEMFTATPVLQEWLLAGGNTRNFLFSKKIANLLPEFHQDGKSSMDYIFNDFNFAKSQGWLEKYTL